MIFFSFKLQRAIICKYRKRDINFFQGKNLKTENHNNLCIVKSNKAKKSHAKDLKRKIKEEVFLKIEENKLSNSKTANVLKENQLLRSKMLWTS